MAGRAGRTYKRDGNGRFASTGGGGSKRPAAKRVAKGPNKVTRDNAGRITSVGGDGATMRGGRLRTAGGKLRATQTARVKAPGAKAGTIAKGGRGVSGAVARSLAAVRKAGGRKGRKAIGLSRARPGQEQRAMQRAQANEKRLEGPAMRGSELRTRAGVGYAVAKGAQGYYSGKTPRQKATFSPLTRSTDKKALAARRKKVVDNNKPQKLKSTKLGFEKADFARRSQRTASIKNPKVKRVAERFYGKVGGMKNTPNELKSMFRKLGKPKKS